MERYAPTLKDLAPRDFVSRCMDQEIKEGRGCGPNKDYIVLDMTHLGAETIMKRLPSVLEIGHNFANVDITKEPIPVVPTIHYQMGGMPTNIHGQVVAPKDGNPNAVVNGLYAVGECSCVSVHGANRLGTNSLLDLLVFGKAAGNHIVASALKAKAHKPLPADAADFTLARLARLDGSTGGEYAQDVANDIRQSMQQHASVFRTQAMMDAGVVEIKALAERVKASTWPTSQGVQHRAHRGAGSRQPDRGGAGDDDLGGRAPRKPRRAHGRRLRRHARAPERPQRRGLDEAHALVQRRQSPRLQAGAADAAQRRIGAAQRFARSEFIEKTVMTKRVFQIYRYDPDTDAKPRMQTIEVELDGSERMLLDALNKLKAVDPTLSFRRSCREGVCGSDAMNINGKNGLACLTNMRTLPGVIVLKPLPGLPVIRDLIVDMTQFFKQYNSIKPYLVNDETPPEKSACNRPKSATSSTACTSASCVRAARRAARAFWWNPTSSSARPGCCRPTASSPTAATRTPAAGSTTSKTRTGCSAATRS